MVVHRPFMRVVLAAVLLCGTGPGAVLGEGGPVLRPGWRADYQPPGPPPHPEDNPWTPGKAALGGALFFDPILSESRRMSCATCHQPGIAWADRNPLAIGDRGVAMDLRSPTLLNVAWLPRLGWDGKFDDVEAVSFRAIGGAANMALPVSEVLDRLAASPAYVRRFAAVFGPGEITQARVEQALAAYQRGLVSGPAPFDRWVAGDEAAVPLAAKRGFALFEGRAGCAACHAGWAFTDGSFADIGSAVGKDIGRGRLFPSSLSLRYAFKTPTLRDVALRAPYMHNGAQATLADVLELYDRGGIERPSRSPKMRVLNLSAAEKADVIAFLQTLTEDRRPFSLPLPPR